MFDPIRRSGIRPAILSGLLAGAAASTVQSAVGLLIDKLLLPPEHDNNISPRFVDRATGVLGVRTHPVVDWLLGVGFHFGYGMGWGVLFGLTDRLLRLPRPLLGTLVGGMIYTLAFSRIGLGTYTRTEEHPGRRPLNKHLDLFAVAFTFGLSLAWLYAPIERRLRDSGVLDDPPAAVPTGEPAQPLANARQAEVG